MNIETPLPLLPGYLSVQIPLPSITSPIFQPVCYTDTLLICYQLGLYCMTLICMNKTVNLQDSDRLHNPTCYFKLRLECVES